MKKAVRCDMLSLNRKGEPGTRCSCLILKEHGLIKTRLGTAVAVCCNNHLRKLVRGAAVLDQHKRTWRWVCNTITGYFTAEDPK